MQKEQYQVSKEIWAYRKQGQIDRALELTEQAIESFPDEAYFNRILGDITMSTGRI